MSPRENEMLPDNEISLLCIHHYDSSDNYARLYTQALSQNTKFTNSLDVRAKKIINMEK